MSLNTSKNIFKVCFCCLFVFVRVPRVAGVLWEQVRCSTDADQRVPEGTVADIGRFPWLGALQHSFYLGGKTQFAITTGVLIHPAYAIAPAQDISKISYEQLRNNTKFILWHNFEHKYALDVLDYILHPQFEEQRIQATVALLELSTGGETGVGENAYPVLPICMPISGGGTFTDLYAVKFTDESGELQKEVYKMKYIDDVQCKEFYDRNELTYDKMSPVSAYCAAAERSVGPCVWDGGVALVTRQSWGFWKLIGFGVRGPGCGAPARFLVVHEFLAWINDMLTQLPLDHVQDVHRLGIRRLSPIKIIMYNADKLISKEQGQCNRKTRGGIIYKDAFEVTMTKDFGQGFFYAIVSQIADFTCAVVFLEDYTARSNAAIWVEHYCHRELAGIAHNQDRPMDYRKNECFMYFKSAAFVKFRFYFSFKATVEMALYGREEVPRKIPNPFMTDESTEPWWPTNTIIQHKDWDVFTTINQRTIERFTGWSHWTQ